MCDKINKTEFRKYFEDISEDLGIKIKKARQDKGYSVLQLSKLTGVSDSYISKVENNKIAKVSVYIYALLCYYLDIKPDEFFEDMGSFQPFIEMEKE